MTAAVRPLRMVQQSYVIHRCNADGWTPVWTPAADTLQGCIEAAMALADRGDQFLIRETDAATGDVWLRFYQVKQRGTVPAYRGNVLRMVPRLVAEPTNTVRLPGGEWAL